MQIFKILTGFIYIYFYLDRGSGPHFKSITGWGLRKDDKIDCGGFGIDGFFPDPFGTCGIPEARRPIDRQISTKI